MVNSMHPLKSKHTERGSWAGSLAAEFADLAPKVGTTPPKGAANAYDLAKLWGLSDVRARTIAANLVRSGKLRFVGKFHAEGFGHPVHYYVRVR